MFNQNTYSSFLWTAVIFILPIILHYSNKYFVNDYEDAKKEFDLFLEENKSYTDLDYFVRKNKVNMAYSRSLAIKILKWLSLIIAILWLINLFKSL